MRSGSRRFAGRGVLLKVINDLFGRHRDPVDLCFSLGKEVRGKCAVIIGADHDPFNARRNKGLGAGLCRVFPVHAPVVANVVVKKRGQVRRAKLYYLRDRTGKSARVREQLGAIPGAETMEAETTQAEMPKAEAPKAEEHKAHEKPAEEAKK